MCDNLLFLLNDELSALSSDLGEIESKINITSISEPPDFQHSSYVEVHKDFYIKDLKIPQYSKGILVSQSPDAVLIVVDQNANLYVGFRNTGSWDFIRKI